MQKWSDRWWNWMVGQPKLTNPTEDSEGKSSNNCQIHKGVFFLCGTTTGKKQIKRTCGIPDGKSILLPVICYEHSLLEDGNVKNPSELIKLATEDLNQYEPSKVSAKVDKDEYSIGNGIIRIRSPLFSITLPKDNVWNSGNEGSTLAGADGYWIFINDLDPGVHNITVRAQPSGTKSASLEIDTSYKITVGS
jgi:hypothetical protein